MVVLVKDVMSKPVVTIEYNKSAKKAAELMKKPPRKGCLVVIKDRKPIGIISDSDLIKKVVARNVKGSEINVIDVMGKPLVTVNPNDDVLIAVRKMKKSNIHRLPVVEGEKVVGLISMSDIARTSPEMLDLLEYRLKMKEEPVEIKEKETSGICDNCGNYNEHLIAADDQWLCENCKDETASEY